MSSQDMPVYIHEGSAEFEFDLAGPLFHQILRLLNTVRPIPLDDSHLERVVDRAGVYVLHRHGIPVYVGKADDSVRRRLGRHKWTLAGRKGLEPGQMTFAAVCFAATWDPFKPEKYLIKHYGTDKGEGWNGKGFGSNEPGVNRGTTRLNSDNFYRRFPLKEDWPCPRVEARRYDDALELLRVIKDEVPFYFKFQGNRLEGEEGDRERAVEAREDYALTPIDVPRPGMTAKDLLFLVASKLPGEWQATITPSHMLLYKERDGVYPQMKVIWPPNAGS